MLTKKLEESPQPSIEHNNDDKTKSKLKGKNTSKLSKNNKNNDNTDLIDSDKNALNDGNADMTNLNVDDEDNESKFNE